jgi:hypothetical protein
VGWSHPSACLPECFDSGSTGRIRMTFLMGFGPLDCPCVLRRALTERRVRESVWRASGYNEFLCLKIDH